MSIINVSLCLSDLPKDKMKAAEKNGKIYINLVVADRREADNYGNTHTLYVSQTKEEREAKANKTYVGQGKVVDFTPVAATTESVDAMPEAQNFNDLPF
ncbi:MAG: hypothetical protein LBV41_02965 [Cytophagaceae bacterium]|jgi:hypothetical protein|nr:hypothetical protein [Cytophagaceae bacterium]